MKQDFLRSLIMLSPEGLRSQIARALPKLDQRQLDKAVHQLARQRQEDPLADLSEGSMDRSKTGGQFDLMKLTPNFEMALYLAQATGSIVVTDSATRWDEITHAVRRGAVGLQDGALALEDRIHEASFLFPQGASDVVSLAPLSLVTECSAVIGQGARYLSQLVPNGSKINFEAGLGARFSRAHRQMEQAIERSKIATRVGRVRCAFPIGGIQDNTVNRLLLMSSSEHHLQSVPMAFFVKLDPPT